MTRLRSIAIAFVALVLSAGAALAFADLPEAAAPGLEKAGDAAGKTVPVRAVPEQLPNTVLPNAVEPDNHGVDVSTVARGDDPTSDTNRGADVSAAARDNHGQATAAENKPENAGPPVGAGKPEGAGQPDEPGQPEDPGPPEGAGKP